MKNRAKNWNVIARKEIAEPKRGCRWEGKPLGSTLVLEPKDFKYQRYPMFQSNMLKFDLEPFHVSKVSR
jgi:hypothetical protein